MATLSSKTGLPSFASSATGAGRVNYFSNSGFEIDATTGVSTYADAAGTAPVDGTGGSPLITTARITASPLNGTGSLEITKPASNRQGEGVAFACTVPVGYVQGRKCEYTLLIDTDVANYVAGDFVLYIYDVTNSTLITPSTTAVPKMKGPWTVSWDSSATGAVYRAIIHCAATHTNAFTVKIDDVVVGPGIITQGAAVSEWQSYTPTITNNGSMSFTATGQQRRVGSSVEVMATYIGNSSNAGAGATGLIFGLIPSGLTLNTSAVPTDGVLGFCETFGIVAATQYAQPTKVFVNGSSLQVIKPGANAVWQTGDINVARPVNFYIRAVIPIAEWAGNGTVNLGAGAQVEYAWNSSTSTATNDVDFGYGPQGVLFQNFAPGTTASVRKRVQFQYPIQSDDVIEVEVSTDRLKWIPFNTRFNGLSTNDAGTTYYGFNTVINSATQFDVNFYSAAFVGVPWSDLNTWYWRVRKAKASSPVGFSNADSNSAGLVKPRKGQYSLTVTGTGWTTSRAQGLYYQDQDGNHRLKFNLSGAVSAVSATTLTITGVTFKNFANHYQALAAFGDAGAYAYTTPGASTIYVGADSGTSTNWRVSGDVELESKPSWA